jgi:aryl-alcohol dehydrogenase-like predicted oxidoreductase
LIEDLENRKREGQIEIVKKLSEYAEEKFGCSTAQLALAWCLKNSNVSTILLGATKPEQMEENLGCIAVATKMNHNHLAEIDLILGNKPEEWTGYGGSGARDIRTM